MKAALTVFSLLTAGVIFGQPGLPQPGGPFPIGRRTLFWKDATRPEEVGPTRGQPREIAAYVFHPSKAEGPRSEYFPGLAGIEDAPEARILRLQFGGAWKAVVSGTVRTNSCDAPPIAAGRVRFPVLIFSPGGQAPVLAYQIQLEELASRGYVVFALEHGTDSALIIRPDRTMITYVERRPPDQLPSVASLEAIRDAAARRSADIVFAVSQISTLAKQAGSFLRGRLDLSRIGVFGHSAGGQAAIRACQMDSRVRACLNQDGEMFGIPLGSTTPIPTVLPGQPTRAPAASIFVAEQLATDAQLAAVSVTRKQFDDWRASKNAALRAFLQRNTDESDLIAITAPGYVHATFMDIRLLGSTPSRDAVTRLQTLTYMTRAFFDARLRWGSQKDFANFAAAPGPGVTVESLGAHR